MKVALNLFLMGVVAVGTIPVLGGEKANPETTVIPASSISRNGFARSRTRMKKLDGQVIRVCGYVDYSNFFPESLDGRGVYTNVWRFNMKSAPDDAAGKSFGIRVKKDEARSTIQQRIRDNMLAGKPTKVYISGKVSTYDLSTNFRRLTGFHIDVSSSTGISFQEPVAKLTDDNSP